MEPRPAHYRCKFPAEYAVTAQQHAKTVYVKEAAILPAVDEWLAGMFTEDEINATSAALESTFGPDPAEEALELATRGKIKESTTPSLRGTDRHSKPAPTPRSTPTVASM